MKTQTDAPLSTTRRNQPLEGLQIVLSMATEADREVIYRLRHEVYARELGQHAANPSGSLRDALDDWNIYLVAKISGRITGFISLTPPPGGLERSAELQFGAIRSDQPFSIAPNGSSGLGYSIDKYVSRDAL